MDKPLCLWAESPEEARLFIQRARRQGFAHEFGEIYVAKRSPKNRSNDYVDGQYFVTSNNDEVTVYDEVITAPERIVDLVQWCTCDIMVSRGDEPIVVVEDTTHIVRMNVYQRIPRLFRAALSGVPAVALQGTRGLNFELRGDCWGMHRYMRAFAAIARQKNASPVLPIYYIPGDATKTEKIAEGIVFSYIDALLRRDDKAAHAITSSVLREVGAIDSFGFRGHQAPDIQSIDVQAKAVTVRIGAKPDKKSWREKGSGQMDPYIGMIAAAKYIYCYDVNGQQAREMVVEFTYLPQDFWWFRDWKTSRSLYKTLAFEIADRVEFNG